MNTTSSIHNGSENPMKIVVIGGSGLIGKKVVKHLREQGHEVLPASRERLSFTGWFRRRPLEGFV